MVSCKNLYFSLGAMGFFLTIKKKYENTRVDIHV